LPIVDADCQPDQQDHRADRLVHTHHVADQRRQPERARDGGHAEQQRDACRGERAERDDEDRESHRDRGELGAAEVGRDAVVDRLVRAAVAELADAELRVRAPDGGGRGERRGDSVGCGIRVAGELEGQQRRAPVTGDLPRVGGVERRFDRGDRGDALEPRGQVVHGGAVEGAAAALEEHLLAGTLGGKLLDQRALGLPRVADAVVLVAHVHHARRGADGERHEHEGEPAEDGVTAVGGAPPGSACGDALSAHSDGTSSTAMTYRYSAVRRLRGYPGPPWSSPLTTAAARARHWSSSTASSTAGARGTS
jgi:hypothetical protein